MASGRTDRAWADYSARFRNEVLPKLLDSAVFLSIHSDNPDWDVRQATELGAALLLDKPLLLIVPKGRTLGEHLRRAADVVVDEWDATDADAQVRIHAAMRQIEALALAPYDVLVDAVRSFEYAHGAGLLFGFRAGLETAAKMLEEPEFDRAPRGVIAAAVRDLVGRIEAAYVTRVS